MGGGVGRLVGKRFQKALKSSADRVSNVLKFDLWGSVTVGQLVGEKLYFSLMKASLCCRRWWGGEGR